MDIEYVQSWTKVGFQLAICETIYSCILFINYYIIFHIHNCKLTCANQYINICRHKHI